LTNISIQNNGSDVSEGLASLIVLAFLVLRAALSNQSSEIGLVASNVADNLDDGGLGVFFSGFGEIAEESLVDSGNLRAAGLNLVVVTIEGNNISNQSDGVRARSVQIGKSLVEILKEGDVSAFLKVSGVLDVEVIVETFEELRGRVGAITEVVGKEPVVSDSGGGEGNEDGEEEELEHLCLNIY